MDQQHFVFLLKDDVITPQSLEDSDAGEVIRAMLQLRFFISHIHVMADDNIEAMRKFNVLSEIESSVASVRRTVILG